MREILDEQDEIRRELNALKLQSELFKRRLNKLDRLSILQMQLDELVISSIRVDQGHVLKRMRARARGRSVRILKRHSHLTVILRETEVTEG